MSSNSFISATDVPGILQKLILFAAGNEVNEVGGVEQRVRADVAL